MATTTTKTTTTTTVTNDIKNKMEKGGKINASVCVVVTETRGKREKKWSDLENVSACVVVCQ